MGAPQGVGERGGGFGALVPPAVGDGRSPCGGQSGPVARPRSSTCAVLARPRETDGGLGRNLRRRFRRRNELSGSKRSTARGGVARGGGTPETESRAGADGAVGPCASPIGRGDCGSVPAVRWSRRDCLEAA